MRLRNALRNEAVYHPILFIYVFISTPLFFPNLYYCDPLQLPSQFGGWYQLTMISWNPTVTPVLKRHGAHENLKRFLNVAP